MRSLHAFSAWCAVVVAGLLRATTAAAQPAEPSVEAAPGFELVWLSSDCDRGAEVLSKVRRMLDERQAQLPAIVVTVTVAREAPNRFVALLETAGSGGSGRKRLEGESCDAIALGSAVVIALSIDPSASLDTSAPPAPEPAEPKPAPVPAPPPPRRQPPAVERREARAYLHGSIGVLFGLLGDPSAFTGAGVGVRYRRVSLELGGDVYQARDVTRGDRPQVGAELKLFSADLLGCYSVLPLSLGAVEACPGLRLEYLRARSFGVSEPDEGQVLILAGIAALRGRLHPTPWLSAVLDLGVAARPFYPTFVLRGVGDVFEIPIVSPFARTGLSLEF